MELFCYSAMKITFILISGPFPPYNGVNNKRPLLHMTSDGGSTLVPGLNPPSAFFDNMKFYDFVLHAEDIKRIYYEGLSPRD